MNFPRLLRNYCTRIIKEKLKIQTFCDISINVPYNVLIKPLDVHKHYDELKIELVGLYNARNTIKHIQNGNNIKIFAGNQEFDENITCSLEVPIKANLNVTTHGNISTGFFNGPKLILKSTKGNIFVEKYHGDKIELSTDFGDIVMKGAVVAADIKATVGESGSIKTKRLQGLSAHLSTNQGNIVVDASYCDHSIFEAKSGNLELQNIHKHNKIVIEQGNLNLNGLDGQLEADLQNTKADIQITRILEDSRIVLKDGGDLILRLSEDCQDNTLFEIEAKNHKLVQPIKSVPSTSGDVLYLMPKLEEYRQVFVKCDGLVQVSSASWMNMLKLNIKK